jgi:hypothetical protein
MVVHVFVIGLYFAPSFTNPVPVVPPHIIISVPVQIAEWPFLAAGLPPDTIYVHVFVVGLNLPPSLVNPVPLPLPPQTIISVPLQMAVWLFLTDGIFVVPMDAQLQVKESIFVKRVFDVAPMNVKPFAIREVS